MTYVHYFDEPLFVRPVAGGYLDPTGTYTTFNTHFSSGAVTFEALGEGKLTTTLRGTFQQDVDGNITGTIDTVTTWREDQSFVYDGIPIEKPVVTIETPGVDFSQYPGGMQGTGSADATGLPWVTELDAAFFGGDNDITVTALSGGADPLQVKGHDGNDRILIEPEFYDYFGRLRVSEQILPNPDVDLTNDERWKAFAPAVNSVIDGGDGDDYIASTFGNDTVFGGAGDDFILSGYGNDRLYGGPGNDELRSVENGILADDTSLGATVVYDYPSSNFVINVERNIPKVHVDLHSATLPSPYKGIGPSAPTETILLMRTITVLDKVSEREGNDTLTNIDFLEFQDRTINLNELGTFHFHTFDEVNQISGNATALDVGALRDAMEMNDTQARELVEVYTAFFDRAPDALGLYFWAQHVVKGMTLNEVAGHLATSIEAQALFPFGESGSDFITAVFQNVLNRPPDTDGLRFWSAVLNDGQIGRGELVLEIIRGTRAETAVDDSPDIVSQRTADALFLEAKTYLGLYFSAYKGMSNVAHAETVFETFDGGATSFAEARTLIEGYHDAAMDPETGELLITMVGITGGLFDA